MRLKLKDICRFLGFILLIYMATCSTLLNQFIPGIIVKLLPVLVLCMFILANQGKFIKKFPIYYLPWGLFGLFIVAGLLRTDFYYISATIPLVLGLFLGLLLIGDISWIKILRKVLFVFVGMYVLFTYFFCFFPKTYPIMIDLYGYLPPGTDNAMKGYRAGLANHYSSNGIYISLFLLLVVAFYFANQQKALKKNKKTMFLMLLTFCALLLTAKRGILIWSLVAIVLMYIVTAKRKINASLKLLVVLMLSAGIISTLIDVVPMLNDMFMRLLNLGTDTASLERFAMWQLAISMFLESPILGTGFWSFFDYYAESLFGIFNTNIQYKYGMAAHNVYFQVLGETGIVGFGLYVLAIGMVFIETLRVSKVLVNDKNREVRFGIRFSLCVQLFYLFYSLSGNCLYDIMFYFYAIAMAITTSLKHYVYKNEMSYS